MITSGVKNTTAFDVTGNAHKLQLAETVSSTAQALCRTQLAASAWRALAGRPEPAQFHYRPVMPLTRGALYSRVSYDLSPSTEIYATLLYSAPPPEHPGAGQQRQALTIKCDNPYLLQTGLYPSTAACARTIPTALASPATGEHPG